MTLISFVGVGWQELWDNSAALLAPTEMQQDIFRDPCSRAPRSNAMYRSKSCIHKRSRHLSQAIRRGFEQQRLDIADIGEWVASLAVRSFVCLLEQSGQLFAPNISLRGFGQFLAEVSSIVRWDRSGRVNDHLVGNPLWL